MSIYFNWPGHHRIRQFIASEAKLDFSYAEQKQSLHGEAIGYDNDHYSLLIGRGEKAWKTACKAIREWNHFPPDWTRIMPDTAPVQEGENVAVLIRLFGFWWMNSARIIYTIDELNRFGFAYGTLPGHVEKGEEVFLLERGENEEVTYHIKAFSKPRYWLTKIGYPIVRLCQKRFARHSMNRMKKLVAEI